MEDSAAGPREDFDPKDTCSTRLNIIVWFLCGLAAVFVCLRLYCKSINKRRLWWDDYVLIGSWILVTTNSILVSISVHLGLGQHFVFVPQENLVPLNFISNICGSVSIVAAVWSKTSFALTLLRLTTPGHWRNFIWFIIISMNLTMGLGVLFTWIHCFPFAKTFNPMLPGSCWDENAKIAYDIFAGVYSGIMDFTLAMMPWKIVWSIQMRRKEKLGVAIGMSMGIFAAATAIIKCIELPNWIGPDYTYTITELSIWGTAETTTTIMAASIPTLRVLLREFHASTKSYLNQTNLNDTALHRPGGPISVTNDSPFPDPFSLRDVDTDSDGWILKRNNDLTPTSSLGIIRTDEIRIERV